MKLISLIEFLRKHLKKVVRVCLAGLLWLIVLDAFFVDKGHAHTKLEHAWGFWAGFGFLACVAIIFVSKWFGHAGIMKSENYYDEVRSIEREP